MTSDDNDDETELQLVYRDFERLRQSHTDLLAAAKYAMDQMDPMFYPIAREKLKIAIAKAEEA